MCMMYKRGDRSTFRRIYIYHKDGCNDALINGNKKQKLKFVDVSIADRK